MSTTQALDLSVLHKVTESSGIIQEAEAVSNIDSVAVEGKMKKFLVIWQVMILWS